MRKSVLNPRACRWMAVSLMLLTASSAWADLMLFPTRIVFEKNQRAAQVELINQGKAPETYRINLVNRRMGENGEFISIDTPGPGEQFADPMLRFSPRQVTIPAGGSQTVRILLRKPADLAVGEYRSHLQFDRVAAMSDAASVEGADKRDDGSIGIVINALVGASIPVIVRHGDTQAQVTLDDLAVVPPAPNGESGISFKINREGNRSVYGDLSVTFTPKGGASVEVAKAGGAAVYVPNLTRRSRLPLRIPPGTSLQGGNLRVVYRERQDAGGRLLAEANMTIP